MYRATAATLYRDTAVFPGRDRDPAYETYESNEVIRDA